jgi:NTE family protein
MSVQRDAPRLIGSQLRRFSVLNGVDDPGLKAIARMGHHFCLPGGRVMPREGCADRALLFVLNGAVAVEVEDAHGGSERVALVGAGGTLGEMSLMTDEPHSTRLVAHRDSEIFALPRAAFERVSKSHPALLRNLTLLLIERLRRTTRRVAIRHAGRAVALVIDHHVAGAEAFMADLLETLARQGVTASAFTSVDAGRNTDDFHNAESGNDLVLYVARREETTWTRQALRQADRALRVTTASLESVEQPAEPDWARPLGDRIVLCPRAGSLPCPALQGLRHQVREGVTSDLVRLARHLSGRAIGVVLSGGGARGFAHLGVLKALGEAGFVPDAIGGTSMGAIIAAGIACEWSADEQASRMREAFVTSNPISDFTVPTVAFFAGRKVRRLLNTNFGEKQIQDLPLPYFCITSDLTLGRDSAHRTGLLAERLTATVALPGVLPPVLIDGHVHVDGGVMNNLPVDHMARMAPGGVVAIDVSGDTSLHPSSGGLSAPGILAILIRTGTVGNEWQRRDARRAAHIVIDPPVQGIGFTEWSAFDRAVASGYETTLRRLDLEPDLMRTLRASAA